MDSLNKYIIKRVIINFKLLEYSISKSLLKSIRHIVKELKLEYYKPFSEIIRKLKYNSNKDYYEISTIILNGISRIYKILDNDKLKIISNIKEISYICNMYEDLFGNDPLDNLPDEPTDPKHNPPNLQKEKRRRESPSKKEEYLDLREFQAPREIEIHQDYPESNRPRPKMSRNNTSNIKINNTGLNLDKIFIKKAQREPLTEKDKQMARMMIPLKITGELSGEMEEIFQRACEECPEIQEAYGIALREYESELTPEELKRLPRKIRETLRRMPESSPDINRAMAPRMGREISEADAAFEKALQRINDTIN